MPFLLLMPSYNQAHFIAEAVESILGQDDPDWELWILDNSTDATCEVMRRYTDPRIHFLHEPRRMDPGSCLNQLLELAKGECFSYVHTDNRLLSNYVRLSREALARHPLALAVCNYWEIAESGQRLKIRRRRNPFPLSRLFSVDSIGVPFSATTELARRLGGFSASDLADDVLFVLRADALGPRVHISTPIMEYRVHTGSRFLSSGGDRVRQAIHRSVLQAYSDRAESLPNPFEGGVVGAIRHVEKASGMARILASSLLKGVKPGAQVWIEAEGVVAFWLAWAAAEKGYKPIGFQGKGGTFLGLPCSAELPSGAVALGARAKGSRGLDLNLRWMMAGFMPWERAIKRLPGDVMSALLVPYQKQTPRAKSLAVVGSGPLAAYLAFGAAYLGGLEILGGPQGTPWPWLENNESTAEAVWVTPDSEGRGIHWAGGMHG